MFTVAPEAESTVTGKAYCRYPHQLLFLVAYSVVVYLLKFWVLVMAAKGDVSVARKGGNIKVSIPEETNDSDIEQHNADGMWSGFNGSFVYC